MVDHATPEARAMKPCPFCKSTDTHLFNAGQLHWGHCRACGANGPADRKPAKALADWNAAPRTLTAGEEGWRDTDASASTEIVMQLRELAKEVTGGNCAFADDDARLLALLAGRAIKHGLTDGLPIQTLRNIKSLPTPAGEGEKSEFEAAVDRLRTYISLAGDELEGGDVAMATFERMRRPLSHPTRNEVLREAVEVARWGRKELEPYVHAAAVKWCGEKDRETFSSDIAYFENNSFSMTGFYQILIATAIEGLMESGE